MVVKDMRYKIGAIVGMVVIVLVMGTLSAGSLSAQTTERFRQQLAMPDSLYRSRVIVQEIGDASEAIRRTETSRTESKINGYRVRVFFDNSQNARAGANATREMFEEMYPDIPAQVSYENPYWKVTVGNCLTNEEAIILWGRVKGTFNRAFVIREEIPIAELGGRGRISAR